MCGAKVYHDGIIYISENIKCVSFALRFLVFRCYKSSFSPTLYIKDKGLYSPARNAKDFCSDLRSYACHSIWHIYSLRATSDAAIFRDKSLVSFIFRNFVAIKEIIIYASCIVIASYNNYCLCLFPYAVLFSCHTQGRELLLLWFDDNNNFLINHLLQALNDSVLQLQYYMQVRLQNDQYFEFKNV